MMVAIHSAAQVLSPHIPERSDRKVMLDFDIGIVPFPYMPHEGVSHPFVQLYVVEETRTDEAGSLGSIFFELDPDAAYILGMALLRAAKRVDSTLLAPQEGN